MKIITVLLIFMCSGSLFARFDIENYKKYLSEHKDMNYSQLLDEYPAGNFLRYATNDFSKSDFGDSIKNVYSLTDYEISLINKYGFMVTERLNYYTFIHAFWDIYKKDLPVYISTDAILHALHFSFGKILKNLENFHLKTELQNAIELMRVNLWEREIKGKPEIFLKAVNDLDVYLTMTEKLLLGESNCILKQNDSIVNDLSVRIKELAIIEYKLFSDKYRTIDFSQFTPRGHYTESEELTKYFQAMMWLGRIDISLTNPENTSDERFSDEELQRMTLLTALIAETAVESEAIESIGKIERILTFLIGRQDNIDINEVISILDELSFKAEDICDVENWKIFREKLFQLNSSHQLYNSQILITSRSGSKQAEPSAVFKLLGQRPVLDGFITANVVFDRVFYKDTKILRMVPSTLDILFALGNDASIQLLNKELTKYPYSSNLAALRYLINAYDDEYWGSTFYTNWLNGIRMLNPPLSRTNLPKFMQTAAWWQKTMSTQLASWSQLRHDFLLYAKQPYTESYMCSYPHGFVEPVPHFYKHLSNFFSNLKDFLSSEFKNSWISDRITELSSNWISSCNTLAMISEKILANEQLSNSEAGFINNTITDSRLCDSHYDYLGWYPELYYEFDATQLDFYQNSDDYRLAADDFVVADVHTIPIDDNGNEVGWVLHAGTGRINLSVITAAKPDGGYRSYIGPVFSYYEFMSNNFKRLTDQEWREMDGSPAYRPDFTNIYLADKTGNAPNGPESSLFTYETSVEENNTEKSNYVNFRCYPNPFTNLLIFDFKIDENMTDVTSELVIYDLEGCIVNTIFNQKLYSGSYSVIWDATNQQKQKLNQGTYIYKLKIGEFEKTGKVTLLK